MAGEKVMEIGSLISVPNVKFLDLSKLEASVDKKIKCDTNEHKDSEVVENVVGKGENAG